MKKHEQPKSKLEQAKEHIADKRAQDREKARLRYNATKMKIEDRKAHLQEASQEMSDDLRRLLSKELEDKEKNEKTRGSEMLSIFAAHNYYADGLTPVELRTTLEDLGPTYVKIGQIMSSRVDLLPEEYCKELEKLRSNVKPLDSEVVRAMIEQETGKKIDEIYSEFSDKPLGSASIGQVHYGVLKDGTKVVTKVQRPLIADTVVKDFELLKKLAGAANVVTEGSGSKTLDLVSVLEELEKVTYEELDFRVEAERTKFFKEHCVEDENVITCPTVIDELTTSRIFTMTFVDGVTLAKKDVLIEKGYDLNAIGQAVVSNFVHQVMDVGFFHADPHQGNIMVSEGIPYWIDFGMIGQVTEQDMNFIISMITSLLKGDAEELVKGVESIGATSPDTDHDKILEGAEKLLGKYSDVTSVNDLDVMVLFNEVMDLAKENNVELPGRFTMLGRSVITIEGVIEDICPELNLLELLTAKISDRIKKSFDLKKTAIDFGKGVLDVGSKTVKIPAQISDMLNNINRGKLKVNMEVTGLDEPLDRIGEFLRYSLLLIVACVVFLGSCVLCLAKIEPMAAGNVPILALAGILFSIALGIFSVKKLWKK